MNQIMIKKMNQIMYLPPKKMYLPRNQTMNKKMIKIVEVSPRDGLQNIKNFIPTNIKINFIKKLSQVGFSSIEVASFVSPKWIPQMADNREVLYGIKDLLLTNTLKYPVLVPNITGYNNALISGAKTIAVFISCSEGFSKANTNKTIHENLEIIKAICNKAKEDNINVRGYVSCIAGCPYDGNVNISDIVNISKKLITMGCYEISLGDTIGIGTPTTIGKLLDEIKQEIPIENIAVHFHDTNGNAIDNIRIAINKGITVIDSSIGGLGGCPYAKGAPGNVATEKVVKLLNELNIYSNINMDKLFIAKNFILSNIK